MAVHLYTGRKCQLYRVGHKKRGTLLLYDTKFCGYNTD